MTLNPAFANRAAVATPPAPAPVVPSISVLCLAAGRLSVRTYDNGRLLVRVSTHGWIRVSICLPQGTGQVTVSGYMV